MDAEDIKPDISALVQPEISTHDPPETSVDVKVENNKNDESPEEAGEDNIPPEVSADDDEQKNDEQQDDDHKSDDHKNEDSPEEGDEDEDDDNIKVTIDDYDFKAIQKQAQPTKQAAPLVLETNQEPIDISTLDDKPWRKPGADINDYFNYGFDETTWRIYCEKQSQMRQMVNEINEPQETFKIPVVHAAPMVQQNVMPYLDERMAHVMDNRNAPLAQPVPMQLHHQPHHQHHNPQHHQHQMSGGSGRMKVEEDVKKYERRHNRSSERRHSSKSRERRHSKSRERDREKEKDKDKERKRSRSRERRSKETRSRPRSRSREDERRSKRHKSSRHV